jgi:predicted methyltransferase MtxX (methanogen marker protein 4)
MLSSIRILTNPNFPKASIIPGLKFNIIIRGSMKNLTFRCIAYLEKNNSFTAVILAFHGNNIEFKRGTLDSIIRQSGFSKEAFYRALNKK